MRWLDSTTGSTDMNLSKLWEMVRGREAWRVAVHGVTESRTQFSYPTTTANDRLERRRAFEPLGGDNQWKSNIFFICK